jgi:hypothetical protein
MARALERSDKAVRRAELLLNDNFVPIYRRYGATFLQMKL